MSLWMIVVDSKLFSHYWDVCLLRCVGNKVAYCTQFQLLRLLLMLFILLKPRVTRCSLCCPCYFSQTQQVRLRIYKLYWPEPRRTPSLSVADPSLHRRSALSSETLNKHEGVRKDADMRVAASLTCCDLQLFPRVVCGQKESSCLLIVTVVLAATATRKLEEYFIQRVFCYRRIYPAFENIVDGS